jgi:hypothetical protein
MFREISSKHTKQTNYCFETPANFIKQAPNKGENKEQREKTQERNNDNISQDRDAINRYNTMLTCQQEN